MKTSDPGGRAVQSLSGSLFLLLLLQVVGAAAGSAGATTELAECERRFFAEPRSRGGSRCFYDAAKNGDLRDAAAERLRVLVESGPPDNGWGVLHRANIEYLRNGADTVELYRRATEIFARTGEPQNEVLARLNLARFLVRRDRRAEASTEVEAAIVVATKANDVPGLQRARIEQARILRSDGDIAGAYRLLRQVEAELFPTGDRLLQKDSLLLLAVLAQELGLRSESRALHRRYVALAREDGNPYMLAIGLSNLAVDELSRLPEPGAREMALASFAEALEALEAVDHRELRARTHLSLGRLTGGEEGKQHLKRCAELAAEVGVNFTRAQCSFAMASLVRSEDPERALELIERGLTFASNDDAPWESLYGTEIRMGVMWNALSPDEALRRSRAELGMIESLRELQLSEMGKLGVAASWSQPYYWLSGRLLQGDAGISEPEAIRAAFEAIESLRARLLREQLARADESFERNGDRDSDFASLQRQIAAANRQLIDPSTPDDLRRQTLAGLEALERRESQLLADAQGAARPTLPQASLERIVAALGPSQALLSYQVALWEDIYGDFAGGSWLIAATHRGAKAYRLPDRTALEPSLPLYRGLIRRRDGSDIDISMRLFEWLLEDVVEDLPDEVRQLIIVPDGVLHGLPFAALHDSNGRPVIDRFELEITPSSAIWEQWRRDQTRTGSKALALVDPTLSAKALVPVAEERNWWFGAIPGSLPGARREAQAIAKRIGDRCVIREGESATETFLKETDLGPFGVVHFAAHAIVDDRHPQRSAILLGAGGPDEDGLLQPRDIQRLDFGGKIAVLSACSSASGTVVSGEGLLGLSRAFFRAGSRAVVGNLWPVRDDDSERFFAAFYRHLSRGQTLAAALRSTQLEMIAKGAPTASWAGFVLLGDGNSRPLHPIRERDPFTPLHWALVALTLVGCLLHFMKRRRSVASSRTPERHQAREP